MGGSNKSIAILGLGPVGRAFARELSASGTELILWTRDPDRAVGLVGESATLVTSPVEASLKAHIVLFCVADDALESLASELALAAPRDDAVALHTNGYLGREVLAPLAQNGWSTGKLHPLAPFPPGDGTQTLRDAWCVIDGDTGPPSALDAARSLAERLGAHPLELAPGAPAGRYHAAASLLAGGMAALTAMVEEAAASSFSDPVACRAAYAHLAAATLANLRESGPEAALTGPIARGATGLVEGHLAGLGEAGQARAAYRLLGQKMVELALSRGSIDAEAARAIRALLR